ncbi:MAG: hypothetical protein KJ645_09985 [Planctomycetes bacterium]|nr:hypothetical protein [Planctomycetota bacterium]
MKKKTKPVFAADLKKEETETDSTEKKAPFKRKDARKTSINPLYETTDRYRKVCKPLSVEDFLSAEP